MYKGNWVIVGLEILVLSAASGQAQDTVQAQRLQRRPVRPTETPFTRESLQTETRTSLEGRTITTEMRELSAQDSQGRRVFITTYLSSGRTSTTVDDPVQGVRMVWNSAHPEVKVLHNVLPVPGRKSCWRVEQDPFKPNEAQLGTSGMTCLAAENPSVYGECALPSVADPSGGPHEVRNAPGQADCEQWLQSEHSISANQPAENLGDAVVAGWPAHGCRVRKESASLNGQILREVWITALPPDNNIRFAARAIRETPLPSGDMVKTTTKMEMLRGGEPDEELFKPPKDYGQKVMTTTEVPCDTWSGLPVKAGIGY